MIIAYLISNPQFNIWKHFIYHFTWFAVWLIMGLLKRTGLSPTKWLKKRGKEKLSSCVSVWDSINPSYFPCRLFTITRKGITIVTMTHRKWILWFHVAPSVIDDTVVFAGKTTTIFLRWWLAPCLLAEFDFLTSILCNTNRVCDELSTQLAI